jgi:hypothetical protein
MAGLAVDVRVFTSLLFIGLIGVASLARVVAGKLHRLGCNLTYCCPAIVPILSKRFWNDPMTDNQKHKKREDE